MQSLNEIGLKYKADKCSDLHNFFKVYERVFSPLRNTVTSILEIGVHKGGSLRMWAEYFNNAKVVGVDINPESYFTEPNIHVEIGDATSYTFMNEVIKKHGFFDIIIDDGSHHTSHMINSFKLLFSSVVKNGGYYIIEDLATQSNAFWGKYYGAQDIPNHTFFDFMKELLQEMNTGDPTNSNVGSFYSNIEQVLFEKWICLIKKY